MLHGAVRYCVREERACVKWVNEYFDDCLCNLNDYFSFGFGLVSLLCWGIAEIPQIITNFRSKSSHGISLLFLLTWIAGDIFNLVGCLLEPATLPTQYYTAVLYTASTVILVLQSLFYDYFYSWWKSRNMDKHPKIEDDDNPPNPKQAAYNDSGIPIPLHNPTAATNTQREYYYASARSMASGSTPPTWSYLRAAKSGPPVMGLDHDYSSSDDENHHTRHRRRPSLESPSPQPQKSRTKPRPIPGSAGNAGTFLASSLGMLPGSNAFVQTYGRLGGGGSGRKLLHKKAGIMTMEGNTAAYGQWLGWMMAAIYMGGRVPQIWLNIKRGSVEGLNPLMFIFALIANATYVASILTRTTEWDKIKANLPWLLDAVVCVGLDLFIVLQFIYYKNFRRRRELEEERLVDAKKPLLS